MTRIIDYFESGEEICVAWIESGSCHNAYFEIAAFGSDDTEYDLKLTNDTREVHLYEGPAGLFVLGDPTVDSAVDDSGRAYPALGVSGCVHGLAWDIILSMLTLNYNADEAIELVAVGFGFACPTGFSKICGHRLDILQKRVDALIDDIETPSETEMV